MCNVGTNYACNINCVNFVKLYSYNFIQYEFNLSIFGLNGVFNTKYLDRIFLSAFGYKSYKKETNSCFRI